MKITRAFHIRASHTRASHTRASHKGFTLLEMLLALVIFSLLSIAGWQLLNTVSRSRELVTEHERRISDIDMAFLLMKQDFRQIIDRGVRVDRQVSVQSIFTGDTMLDTDDQAISFVRSGWRNPGQRLPRSELQRVYYRLKEGQLQRLYDLVLDVAPGAEPVTRVLLDDVSSLKFSFFYNKNWHPGLNERGYPEGIRITLELDDLGLLERDFELPERWEAEHG